MITTLCWLPHLNSHPFAFFCATCGAPFRGGTGFPFLFFTFILHGGFRFKVLAFFEGDSLQELFFFFFLFFQSRLRRVANFRETVYIFIARSFGKPLAAVSLFSIRGKVFGRFLRLASLTETTRRDPYFLNIPPRNVLVLPFFFELLFRKSSGSWEGFRTFLASYLENSFLGAKMDLFFVMRQIFQL